MASVARDPLAQARTAMIESQLMPCGIVDPLLLAAFAAVPRERFVAEGRSSLAYAETVQPLGMGRWMATPLATGHLLSAAAVKPGERVLLIGGGTGYTAALLGEMGAQVTMVEAAESLATRARDLLSEWPEVALVQGPLTEGWPPGSPYDLIVFDGAVEFVPAPIIAQLAPGGRIAAILAGADGIHRVGLGHALPPAPDRPGDAHHPDAVAFDDITECPAPLLPPFSLPKTFRF